MFKLINVSNNPLQISGGKVLPSCASREVEEIGDRERRFQSRGWLNIIELDAAKPEKTAPPPAPPQTPAKPEPVKPAAEETKASATPEAPGGAATPAATATPPSPEGSKQDTKKTGDAGNKTTGGTEKK